MRYIFCPRCGTRLVLKQAGDDGKVPYCRSCRKYWFDNFADCVIVMIYNEFNEIALCRQNYLSKEFASNTSGFITPGETAEQAAIREVKEELGLDISEDALDYCGTIWFGSREQLMHCYLALVSKEPFKLSSEVDDAFWVPYTEAPKYMFPKTPENAQYRLYNNLLLKLKPEN